MKKILVAVGVLAVVGVALAQTFTDINNAQYYGRINIPKSHAVIDANFAEIENGPTLESTVSKTDSWGITASHASVTGQYAVIELLDTTAALTDTDYVDIELFEGVNDSSEDIVWGRLSIVVDDNTTNTEDSAIEVYQPVAGVDTKVLDISAGTVAISGAATVGSTLGVTGAATALSLDSQTAGALAIGGATATSLALGASDITTTNLGTFVAGRFDVVTNASTAFTITSAHYGKMIMVTTNDATTLTLPANGAASGSWVEVTVHGGAGVGGVTMTDSCAPTIAAAASDTLIGPNDLDLKSVTWGSGHRLGAQSKFWSDGEFWHVQNLGGTTMTYND